MTTSNSVSLILVSFHAGSDAAMTFSCAPVMSQPPRIVSAHCGWHPPRRGKPPPGPPGCWSPHCAFAQLMLSPTLGDASSLAGCSNRSVVRSAETHRTRGNDMSDAQSGAVAMAVTLITGADVWDGISDAAAPREVLVVDGRIERIGEAIDPPAGAQVIDLPGHTLTPGFMDCHTHVTLNGLGPGML